MFPVSAHEHIPNVPLGDGRMCPHVFEHDDIDAITAALRARRTLLLLGEPGIGKTQLARAAAWVHKWAFCQKVVESRTEARDLKWTEDLVARLADAQLVGTVGDPFKARRLRSNLALRNYVKPGPLWWAFDWGDAAEQARCSGEPAPILDPGCDPTKGVVVLIDEIDKAEAELPNGLLEALGSRTFVPAGRSKPVQAKVWPLIVVTTNDERRLPDAFVRRCVVHMMRIPNDDDEAAFVTWMVGRGKVHVPPDEKDPEPGLALLKQAAELTFRDRQACKRQRLRPLPGQAEYLDLLRAVQADEAAPDHPPIERLEALSKFFLRKHPDLRG